MTDRVIVYHRNGTPLGELDATIVRSWQLEREARAERAVMQVRASNTAKVFTQFRNLVVVVSDVVPHWVGVIWDTRDWDDNNITITIYSAEYLLSFRRTGTVEKYETTPNGIFSGLLKTAQAIEHMQIEISASYIAGGGAVTSKEYNRENIFQAINDLASETEYYWWIQPIFTPANKLVLRAMWQKNRGVTYHSPLVQGSNFVGVKVTEICKVANRIYAVGDVEDWVNAEEYIADDAASRSQFGLIEDMVSDHDISEQAALVAFGNSELNKRKQPRLKVSGKVLSTPFPRIGDNVTVLLSADSLGYPGGESVIARTSVLRIKSVAYSPEETGVNIVADNIYWEV